MEDSNIDPRADVGITSGGVTYRLLTYEGTPALEVSLDRTFLDDPARVYPIRVDPSYNADSDDTYVQNTFPTNNYSAQPELRSGTFNAGTDKVRSYVHFSGVNALDEKVISSAYLKLYNTHSFSCTATPLRVSRVTTSWVGSSTNWSAQPTPGDVIAEPSFAHGYESGGCADAWVSINVTTAMRNWADDTWDNYGILLRAPDEGVDGNLQWKKFSSRNNASNYPNLEVTWSEPQAPSTPSNLSPAGGWFPSAPTLYATFIDPGDSGFIRFKILDSGGQQVASCTSGTVPSGTQVSCLRSLPDGLYTWQAQADDGAFVSAWSSGISYRIDSVAPNAVTTVTSTTHTPFVPSANGSVTVSWPAATDPFPASGVNGYATVWNASASTPAGTTVNNTTTTRTQTLADGNWYFHVRAVDKAGNVGPDTSFGPIYVDASAPFLGLENWWESHAMSVGPQGSASVNPANGNLVVQQVDSTPIKGNGRLGFVIRRTYNSQDTTTADLPGTIGAGWRLNVSEAGDVQSLGVSANALSIPGGEAFGVAGKVTLIDRDGTRHIFTPNSLAVPLPDVTSPSGALATLKPVALDVGSFKVCVDQTYTAPPGVHLSLWRYLRINASGSCDTPASASPVVLGFAAVRPDRVRSEFAALGELLSIKDASGNELRYNYDISRKLQRVYEKTDSCTDGTQSACRGMTLEYDANGKVIKIKDPAGRDTTYTYSGNLLTRVDNPGGTHLEYAYGACNGSAGQLCTAKDPRGTPVSFGYETPPSGYTGPWRVLSMTDRLGSQTVFEYDVARTWAKRDNDLQHVLYQWFDSRGRVAQVHEGSSTVWMRSRFLTWDSTGCRQPADAIDNNLCRVVRLSYDSRDAALKTPDEDTRFVYNAEGQLLAQKRVNASAPVDQTYGYSHQYVPSTGPAVVVDDTVAGSGAVTSSARPTGALFVVSDRTQSLTPRGNAAGAAHSPYLTTYRVDNDSAVGAGAKPTDDTCTDPADPAANTGSVCEVLSPHTTGAKAFTRYTYDTAGRRITMTTPQGAASAYSYAYYPPGAEDLSGTSSAEGWLKAVTDPQGRFVAFAYDRAGNVVRTWDRNVTAGTTLGQYPSSAPGGYTEELYAAAVGDEPWRYVSSRRDQLGNATRYTLDANGNPITVTPPRGVAAANADFDVTQTFDASDNLLTRRRPSGATTTHAFTLQGNLGSIRNGEGNATVYTYDEVNRLRQRRVARGPYVAAEHPTACQQATGADAPIPAGWTVCFSEASYDALDNVIASRDPDGQVTDHVYDAVGREVRRDTPRDDAPITKVRSDRRYDPDGNTLTACAPRQFTEGTGACDSSSVFAAHATYDPAGREETQKTFRQSGQANETAFAYDPAGNLTSVTDANGHITTMGYDVNGRRTTQVLPRDTGVGFTTTWAYDPSGNVTSVTRPGNLISAYSYDDAHRPRDTVVGSSSTEAGAAGTPSADGGSNIRTRTIYDTDSNVVARLSPRAFTASVASPDLRHMVRTDHDADGRATTQWLPRYDGSAHDDPTAAASGDQAAQCPTGANPAYPADVGVCVTRLVYDAASRVVEATLPTRVGADNRYVAYAYTADGLVKTVDAPNPASGRVDQAKYIHDGTGRVIKATDAVPSDSTVTYTADGLVDVVNDKGHTTDRDYDASANPSRTTDALGQVWEQTFYADDLVAEILEPTEFIDPAHTATRRDKTSYAYDAAGNPAEVRSPGANSSGDENNTADAPVRFTYFHDNLLKTSTEPVSPDATETRVTTYGYDGAGRKNSQRTERHRPIPPIPDSDGTQTLAYYPSDRLQRQTGRGGETITTTYDADGNLKTAADSTSSSTITATHYLDSLERTVSDGVRTTRHAYDGAGEPVALRETVDATGTVLATTTHQHNDAGLAAKTTSSRLTGDFTFTHDPAGRPDETTGPTGQRTDYVFNPDDTLASTTLTSGSDTLARFAYAYDDLRRITSQTHSGPGAGGATPVSGSLSYDYYADGRLESFAGGPEPKDATWDPDGNRLRWKDQLFSYRADGSIAADNTGPVPVLYSYDATGRLTSDGEKAYLYDGHDRTRQITEASSTTAFTFDGTDRTASATVGTDRVDLHYLGLSTTMAAERLPATDTSYVFDPFSRALAAKGSTTQFLSDDGQGNIATATHTSNAVACTVRYEPFGEPIAPQGANQENACNTGSTISSLLYRRARRQASTTTYQMGSRTYDPAKAAFLTPDAYRSGPSELNLSVGVDPLTRNRYSYVNGDPINLYDPHGHGPCEWWGIGWVARRLGECRPTTAKRLTDAPDRTVLLDDGGTSSRTKACRMGVDKVCSARRMRTPSPISQFSERGGKAEAQCSFAEALTTTSCWRNTSFQDVRGAIEVFGLVPVIGDVLDLGLCGYDVVRGSWGEAGLSCAAVLPYIGAGAVGLKLARFGAKYGDEALALRRADQFAPETRSLYRAVSTAEAEDLASVGRFRAGPNSYEGKLFATTAEDAARFGRINDALTPGGLPFHIVETRVPSSVASSFESLTTDGMSAVHVAEGQLGALNAAGRWSIWDYVPWVAKP